MLYVAGQEVNKPKLPLLPDKALSDFLKPELMGLEIGDNFTFEIAGPHGVGQTGDTFSLPVKNISYRLVPNADGPRKLMEGVTLAGSFSMNKTTAKVLTTQLKSRNSDDWVGAQFS